MYKLIIQTAFLSLMRRKVRTFLVVFMISISLWALLFMQGIYEGMTEQMINNAIKSDCGHISIYAKGFKEEKSIDLQITNALDIQNKLDQYPNIKSYTKRVYSEGLIATAGYSNAAQIYGINLKDEKNHSQFDRYIIDGEYDFGSKSRGVIIGFKLAKKLKLKVGKKAILSAQNIDNEISSINLKVKAIIKTNNMFLDNNAVFIDIKKAKEFFAINGVSQISIILENESKTDDLQKTINKKFKDLETFRWDEHYPALLQSRILMKQFNLISYLIIFLTASIGIFGVVLVSVMERLREFGILRAIGTQFRILGSIIFFESFIIGIAGFILGCILGGATLYYFNMYGLDLSTFSDALDEFGMDAITYAIIKVEYFITAFVCVCVAMILSSLFPLWILKRSKPIDMIRG